MAAEVQRAALPLSRELSPLILGKTHTTNPPAPSASPYQQGFVPLPPASDASPSTPGVPPSSWGSPGVPRSHPARPGALTGGVPEAELDALRVDLEAGRVVLEDGGHVALRGADSTRQSAQTLPTGPPQTPKIPKKNKTPIPSALYLGEAVLGEDVEQRGLAALAVPHHHDLALDVLVGIHHRRLAR